uniref:Uncharacterized protein LOC102805103 n=1 Tax=Saccoglossus kowalevskii TaxID=10224 RepID=A0ABM0MTG9_SACKO
MTSNTPQWVEEPGFGLHYYAHNCGLSKFPSEVFDESRRNIVVIFMHGNNISEIPENISCLRHLKGLELNNNNLSTIPDNIGNLSQLEVLYLDRNPLIDLPVSLRRLKNLKTFTCDVIDGILEQDVRIGGDKTKIRKLFDKVFKRKVVRAYVAMAGACHAGKTATKMNLAGEPFDEHCESTVGGDMFVLDLDNWTIEHTARSDESGNKGIHTTRSISRTITASLDREESQQMFMAMLGIYILVVDLSLKLDDVVPHDLGGKKKTLREYTHGWMNSIHSHTTKVGQDQKSIKKNVIVIGTKIDKISKKTMEQRKRELEAFLRSMEAAVHIAWPIIPISNKPMQSPSPTGNPSDLSQSPSPGGNPNDALQSLKDKIKELVCQLSYEVSFNWLQFELLLNQKVVEETLRPVMKLAEVYEVGESMSLSKQEVDDVLKFFHSIRDILHFADDPDLRNDVIISPQWFIDLLRLFITHIPELPDEQKEALDTLISDLYDKLTTHGKLDVQLVEWVLKKNNRLEDKDILLRLFQQYDIIYPCSPQSGSEVTEYYMACLLKSEPENGFLSPSNSTSGPTLYLHFPRKYLPDGFFHQLVIRCIKKWQTAKLFYNDAWFDIGGKHILILSKRESDITLTVKTEPAGSIAVELQSSYGPEVREYVEDNMNILIKRYNPGLSYTPCLKCPCDKHDVLKITPDGKDRDDGCVDRSKDRCFEFSQMYMSDWSFWESSGEDCQSVITKLDVKSGCVSIECDLGKATSGIIERSDDKLNWIPIKTVKAKTGSYKDPGLQSQTIYYYRIHVEDDTSHGYTVSIKTE